MSDVGAHAVLIPPRRRVPESEVRDTILTESFAHSLGPYRLPCNRALSGGG
jgi:hypothetical protein